MNKLDICPQCGYDASNLYENDGSYSCFNCNYVFFVQCPLCHGEGFMPENEMECDWVNFSDREVICCECNGNGVTSDPSFQ